MIRLLWFYPALIAIALFVFCISSYGQDLPASPTLDDLLAYAERNNPGLQAARQNWQSSLLLVPEVTSLPDPRFSYGYYIEEVETRVGPQRHRFGLSQTFPWFGKLGLRGEVAEGEAAIAESKLAAEELRLFHDIQREYFEYYYLSRSLEVTRENMDLLNYFESVARTRFKTGAKIHSAILRVQMELGRLEDRLRSIEDMQPPVVAKINALLGRPAHASLPWPEDIPDASPELDFDGLAAAMDDFNPRLQALEAQAQKHQSAAKLAGKAYYPDLTFGIDYIQTDDSFMPDVRDDGKDPVIASVALNLPIWHKKYRATRQSAQKSYEAAMQTRENLYRTLAGELKMALYRYEDAQRKIALYRDALIPKADQSLGVLQQSFSAGDANFLDLIDAERTLLEFQLLHERAVVDRAQALAKIALLVGGVGPGNAPQE